MDFTPMTPKRSNPVPRKSFIPQNIPVPNKTFLIGLGIFLVVSALYKAIGMLDSRQYARPVVMEGDSLSVPLVEEPTKALVEVVTEEPPIDISQYVPLSDYEEKLEEVVRLQKQLSLVRTKLETRIDPRNCPTNDQELHSCYTGLTQAESSLATCQEERQSERVAAYSLLQSTEELLFSQLVSATQTFEEKESEMRGEIKKLESRISGLKAELVEARDFFSYRLLTPLTIALGVLSCIFALLLGLSRIRSRHSQSSIATVTQAHEQEMFHMRCLLAETSALSREIGCIMKEVIADTSQVSTHQNSPSASPSGSSLSEKLEASSLTPIRVELSNQGSEPMDRRISQSPVQFSIASPAHQRHKQVSWPE